jgi:MFS transporter, SP family, sugar:H+ symporter
MNYWLKLFTTDGTLTSSNNSLIVSILSAGTFFGALAAAPLADSIGRRLGLMIGAGVVFNFGVILQAASTKQPLFVAGRFFAGLGVGLVSAQIPMYQSETSPKWIRGTIVGAYQLAITIGRTSRDYKLLATRSNLLLGLLLAAIVNNGTKNRNDTGSYRIPICVQFAWSLVLVTG